jgi:hypothetical protein
MALNVLQEKGTPLAQQHFTWKKLVQWPFSNEMMMPSHGSA